ncbi:MAG: hypothetical protein PHG00_17300 [Methylococcales bacterium]|nr:hypothetical protein [Methylococcales bacterium]
MQTFGYGIEDVPTLADRYLKAYPDPDYRHRVEAACLLTHEQPDLEPLEAVIRCKNNSIKTVLVSVTAIHHNYTSASRAIMTKR